MLKLLYGLSGAGKTEEIYRRISDTIEKEEIGGRKIYLIVPEQGQVEAEKECAAALPPSYPLFLEIENFSRLPDSVFRSYGGISFSYAQKSAKKALMWRAITELSPQLSYLANQRGRGVCEDLLALYSDLSQRGVSLSSLEDAKEKLKNEEPELSSKLGDIALVFTYYRALLEEKYRDDGRDIEHLSALLDSTPHFADADIYIDSFSSFTGTEYALIERLLKQARQVTVTLCGEKSSQEMWQGEITDTALSLKAIAERCECEVCEEEIEGEKRSAFPALLFAKKNVFNSFSYEGDDADSVSFYSFADIREESEAVFSEIARLVREEGASYRDIAILTRDLEERRELYRGVSSEHGIPCFIDGAYGAQLHPAIRAIYSALSAIVYRFRREDVISFIKSGYTDISYDDGAVFEKYTEVWSISEREYLSNKDLSMNPHGYAESTQKTDSLLLAVNRARKEYCSLIIPFYRDMKEASTFSECCNALFSFLTKMKLKTRIEEEMKAANSAGNRREAEEGAALWNGIIDTLDIINETLSDCDATAEEFLSLLRMLFSDVTLSVIPQSQDAVTFGQANMVRRGDIKYTFLVGANDEEFPREAVPAGYFARREKKLLTNIGISVGKDTALTIAAEQYYFYRAVASPKNRLYLSYVERSLSFTPKEPSSAFLSLSKRFPLSPIIRGDKMGDSFYDIAGGYAIYNKIEDREERAAIAEAVGSILYSDIFQYIAPHISKETMDRIYGDEMYLSQSRVDTYADCAFKYFCNYMLSLERRHSSDFSYAEIGTMVHAVLERAVKDIEENKEGDIKKKVSFFVSEYIEKLMPRGGADEGESRARKSVLFARISRAIIPMLVDIAEEVSVSSFKPKSFELDIGGDEEYSPDMIEIPLSDGKVLKVKGKIDRVDVKEKGQDVYVKIVDYKTGSKIYDEKDIESGKNLQLLIYLAALVRQTKTSFLEYMGVGEKGQLLPAGGVYSIVNPSEKYYNKPLSLDDIKKENSDRFERKGAYLDDGIYSDADEKYLPKGKKNAYAYTPEHMDEVIESAISAFSNIGNDIFSGRIERREPDFGKRGTCSSCEFFSVCRNKTDRVLSEEEE